MLQGLSLNNIDWQKNVGFYQLSIEADGTVSSVRHKRMGKTKILPYGIKIEASDVKQWSIEDFKHREDNQA